MCPANDPVKCASRCIGSWVTIHPGAHGITPRCSRGPEWKSPVVRQSLVYLEKNLSRETWAAFSPQYKHNEKENIWGKTCKMQQRFFFFFFLPSSPKCIRIANQRTEIIPRVCIKCQRTVPGLRPQDGIRKESPDMFLWERKQGKLTEETRHILVTFSVSFTSSSQAFSLDSLNALPYTLVCRIPSSFPDQRIAGPAPC